MKTYLNVPFEEKEEAKCLGARFDVARKQWYVPDGIDLFHFLKWVPNLEISNSVENALKSRRDYETDKVG